MSTDAARILALGAEVEIGGESYQLVLGMHALGYIEREFATYDAWVKAVTSTPAYGQIFRAITTGLEAGLLHSHTVAEARALVAKVHPTRGVKIRDALLEAAAEALPPVKGPRPKGRAADGSRGRTSTGSRPSSSAAATQSSAG